MAGGGRVESPGAGPTPELGLWAQERWRVYLAMATLGAFTAPGMLLLGLSEDPAASPTPILRLCWLPVYASVLLFCWWRWRSLVRNRIAILLLAPLLIWAWSSQAWSILPDVTQRRSLSLTMSMLFGLYLGTTFSPRRFVEIVAGASFVMAIGSLVFALALPRYGIEGLVNIGDWRGLWTTKNSLASFMVLGCLACASASTMAGRHRYVWGSGIVLCCFNLYMSHGKAALVGLLAGLAILIYLCVANRGKIAAVLATFAAGTIMLFGGFALAVAPAVFFKALGKDPTLTGRTDIWASVLRQVADRPLTGYGYSAFWEKGSVPAQVVARETGWIVPEAHNGWIDLLAQLGWTGIACMVALLIVTIVQIVRNGFEKRAGFFPFVYLMYFLLLSGAESVLLQSDILGVLLVGVASLVLSRSNAPGVRGWPSGYGMISPACTAGHPADYPGVPITL